MTSYKEVVFSHLLLRMVTIDEKKCYIIHNLKGSSLQEVAFSFWKKSLCGMI